MMTLEVKDDTLKKQVTSKSLKTILSIKLAFDHLVKVHKQEVQARDPKEHEQQWVGADNECFLSSAKQNLIEKQ